MAPKYDASVFIGRFQPFHMGHRHVIEEALKISRFVIVLVGSSNTPRSFHNPFTFEERSSMIRNGFPKEQRNRIFTIPLEDYTYNDTLWVKSVQGCVNDILSNDHFIMEIKKKQEFCLIGHSKDQSSYYLKLFPMWGSVEVSNFGSVNATDIRDAYFQNSSIPDLNLKLPLNVQNFLAEFSQSPEYEAIKNECEFVKKYRSAWENSPYPPTFVTVDAVVVQSGHVLLVRRGAQPGKGLWALPGGFINQHETIEDAVLRELKEETGIKVPVPVLKGSIVSRGVFDDPNRSLRGRTITHAFLIQLKDATSLPKVRGSDDAEIAFWAPLSSLCRSKFYEDHYAIIDKMVSSL
jgi:bifunctional NMN adenylyltransferase/nudix hydrolase